MLAFESDRAAAKRATHALADLAKNEELVNVIIEEGAILALVQHLQAPPVTEEDLVQKLLSFEHEVEKGSAFVLGLLAGKVLSSMRMLMVEDSNNAQNDSFLLDDSSRCDPSICRTHSVFYAICDTKADISVHKNSISEGHDWICHIIPLRCSPRN